MENSKLTTFGSLVAAIIASLCCIGPVAVALIGVGSIGAFAAFEAYRLPLVGITILLLGLAFYLVYRKREILCEDGTCKIQSASKWNKTAVWLATVLAAIAIAFPYFDLTDTVGAQEMLARQSQGSDASAIAVLDIEGMDCSGCAKGLEATLARLDGVVKAAVEFEKSRAIIEYEPATITSERLIAAVDETGFKASISSVKNFINR